MPRCPPENEMKEVLWKAKRNGENNPFTPEWQRLFKYVNDVCLCEHVEKSHRWWLRMATNE